MAARKDIYLCVRFESLQLIHDLAETLHIVAISRWQQDCRGDAGMDGCMDAWMHAWGKRRADRTNQTTCAVDDDGSIECVKDEGETGGKKGERLRNIR